jgi:hypothetical protein
LAFFLKFVPKVGPFKALDFKIPTRQTEDLYVASVNRTLENYGSLLKEVNRKDLRLTNTDFDTGRLTHAGEYDLSDKTYAHLLDQLAKNNFQQTTPDLKQNILTFYKDPPPPGATKSSHAAWDKVQEELQHLRNIQPESVAPIQVISETPQQ